MFLGLLPPSFRTVHKHRKKGPKKESVVFWDGASFRAFSALWLWDGPRLGGARFGAGCLPSGWGKAVFAEMGAGGEKGHQASDRSGLAPENGD